MAALAVAMGIGRFAFTPVLPMMQEGARLSLVAGGWLAAANYVGYLLGALFALRLRVNAPSLVRRSLVAIALLTALMGVAHTSFGWALLRLLAGVASAWVLVFASAWTLERLAAIGREQLAGVVFAGVGLGIALAGVLCLGAVHANWSWQEAWFALGVAALVLTALVWPAFGQATLHPVGERRRVAAVAGGVRWRLVVSYGLFGFGYIIPATFLPVMAKQVIPGPALFAWVWPAFGFAALGSTIVAAGFGRRVSNRGLWVFAQSAMTLGVALPAVVPGGVAIALSAFLVGGTFMVVTMAGLREAQGAAGAAAAPLMAAMTSAFAFGQIAGPLMVSALAYAGYGLKVPLLVAAGLLAFGVYVLPRVPRTSVDGPENLRKRSKSCSRAGSV